MERFLPLARNLARRYAARGEEDDLLQVASLGLLKAIDRFDASRGLAFTSFAVPTILGELKRHFRDHGWAVRVSRDVQELAARAAVMTDELTGRLQRRPTTAELAQHCGVSIERLLEALAAETAHRPDALDRPSGEGGTPTADGHAWEDPSLAGVEDADSFETWLAPLPELERMVLRLRFQQELSQREIGQRLGLSQMQISRLLRRSLAALREHD
jgi:RNA polymerase sigma-B factor